MTLQIDPKALLAGQPVLRVREMFRRCYNWGIHPADARAFFNVGPKKALAVIRQLEAEGFLEPKEPRHAREGPVWRLTEKGASFAEGRATPPIHRSTADRLLREVVQRMEEVERLPYLYRVERAVVFGSYLHSYKQRLGDLDIGVKLVPKEPDQQRHYERTMARIEEALQEGRTFSNIVDQLFFPVAEVWMFLRGRSRSISFLDLDRQPELPERSGYRVIYPVE